MAVQRIVGMKAIAILVPSFVFVSGEIRMFDRVGNAAEGLLRHVLHGKPGAASRLLSGPAATIDA